MSVNDPPLVQYLQGIAYSTLFRDIAVPIDQPPQMFITDIDQDRLESVQVVLYHDSGYAEYIAEFECKSVDCIISHTQVDPVRLVFSVTVTVVFKLVLCMTSVTRRGSVAAYKLDAALVYT